MPTELTASLGMHALSDLDSSLTTRLLHKGPEYLRRQIDRGDRAKKSAVERLAADKAKYVKSQQVIGTKQEPARLNSASESSRETCSVESRRSSKDLRGRKESESRDIWCPTPQVFPVTRRIIARRQLRPDSLIIYRQKCEFVKGQGSEHTRGGLVRKILQSPSKEKMLVSLDMPRVKEEVKVESEETQLERKEAKMDPKEAGLNGEETRLEKKDPRVENEETRLESEEPGAENKARVDNKDTAPSSSPATTRLGDPSGQDKMPMKADVAPADFKEVKRRSLHRSKSDISSRYSKSFSEFDTFFKYCGLDPEVVEDLGKENFSAGWDHRSFKIRSVSMATSEGGFSHPSGDEGLLEEEVTEQVPSTTSVIERNARIIKWLYTCKKAKETQSKGTQDLAGKKLVPEATEAR
ncbi:protein FAM110C [Sarcophilus harrisii]|uniref:Family with sequence similarity 110 member C n=1 Tax=Sarcophilus harrisii TaxID=9305 RepID=A0A7N4V5P5_SARHA|nr:protein FAM110C [Sarcophilus harrisii]